jgi:hypothetical protein
VQAGVPACCCPSQDVRRASVKPWLLANEMGVSGAMGAYRPQSHRPCCDVLCELHISLCSRLDGVAPVPASCIFPSCLAWGVKHEFRNGC